MRELQNVIDRASIVSGMGKLKIDLAQPPGGDSRGATAVMTDAEVTAFARTNLISALRETQGKVAGDDGAAQLLGVQPTTLYSRIKKHGITSAEWC